MSNRLAGTGSPYLRAHADNPVDWYPWGAEAFAEARRRDVPLLISIGYSTCHWCHVMARESFSDPATAAEIDRGFVAIKVDREEHPEVDAAYMAAAAAFTRDLGWPLTVFATPEGRAFHAGTYFPPVARGGLPSFRTVLAAVQEAWTQRRVEVDELAGAVAAALAEAAVSERGSTPDRAALAGGRRRDRRPGGPALRRFRGRAEVPGRDDATVPAVRRAPRRGRARTGCDGLLRAARCGRRLLPLRDAAGLERAALRAHAHRQCAAARGRARLPATRTSPGVSPDSCWPCCAAPAAGSAPHRTRSRGSTASAARAATTGARSRSAKGSSRPPSMARSSRAGTGSRSAPCRVPAPRSTSRAGSPPPQTPPGPCSRRTSKGRGRLVRTSLDGVASASGRDPRRPRPVRRRAVRPGPRDRRGGLGAHGARGPVDRGEAGSSARGAADPGGRRRHRRRPAVRFRGARRGVAHRLAARRGRGAPFTAPRPSSRSVPSGRSRSPSAPVRSCASPPRSSSPRVRSSWSRRIRTVRSPGRRAVRMRTSSPW